MPSTSIKQAKLMAACAHGSGYKECPPMKVSKEFNKADALMHTMKKLGKKKQKGMMAGKKSISPSNTQSPSSTSPAAINQARAQNFARKNYYTSSAVNGSGNPLDQLFKK